MISLRGVSKSYRTPGGAIQVLRGVDLDVERGSFVAIVGRSGTGKTTLLNIVGGLDSDYTGQVTVDGERLDGLSDQALARYRNRKIGFVFQSFHLLEHLSLGENAALPALFSGGDGRSHAELVRRSREVLELVGLGDRIDDRPNRLSGGQRQRVAIARALFNEPLVLVCDEPTGNLDAETGQQILAIFTRLVAEAGVTLLIVTHDHLISAAAGRQVELIDGTLHDRAPAPAGRPEPSPASPRVGASASAAAPALAAATGPVPLEPAEAPAPALEAAGGRP